MDYDDICQQMSGVTLETKVNEKLVMDLNLIITEIIKAGNYNVDIYEICVNCGHSLTWDQEYTVCDFDIAWLKGPGKIYFYETLNNYIKIDTKETYTSVTNLYNKLLELFSLCVE